MALLRAAVSKPRRFTKPALPGQRMFAVSAGSSALAAFRALALAAVSLAGCAGLAHAPRPEHAPLSHSAGTQSRDDGSVIIARETGFARAADGTRIYYEKLGSGPAIVLIHGLGGNHAVWYRQVPALARDHTVVVVAQRGFAPSEGARDRFDVNELVADVLTVLDAAGIRRAVVVGQSMGGWTALGAALAHPERVAAVVLSHSIAGIFDDEIRTHYRTTLERAREIGSTPPPLGTHPALDKGFCRARPTEGYLYQLLTTFGAPSPGLIAQQLGDFAFSHETLAKLSVPALFITADNDRIFPPEIVRRAASYAARASVVVIPGAGHSAYFERPGEWRRRLLEFLSATSTSPDTAPHHAGS